ncbi:hypothetical protein M2132_001565 [Dysgonomonas sp. PH5-45]|uniref:DUF5686 and carboxypeptidase regulatory-like domain-containing protein n=1 Tax=unclassified Dysgonomonas TaxID=2630389 RepID=UPI0024761ACC|nr:MULTISPECIES: DUF5686 and carboxypeptidase regulatory-like domain-containing protein [unclassified Dysgonomonas]MDH6355227.1 hypothetical protein [Dysgonomonas sp. PH5-45]MDH6388150.1 hypothetical protein [Dysgonomonas sp. PH5-37]
MKYILLLTLTILTFSINTATAQNLRGKVTDKNGEAVYGATVYIKEPNQGLACNEEGEYQTTLSPGKYTIEFRCLGHKSKHSTVSIKKGETTVLDIVLENSPFNLQEVTISKKEDPAYEIMRQAIKKAPVHARMVSSYKSECYIKGVFELQKVGKLVDMLSKTDGMKMSDMKDKLFIQESLNEIEFTAPNKYEQTVKAFSSTIPDDFEAKDALTLMRGSLYEEKFSGAISPLNPSALDYYNFRYEGFTENGKETINKIKVIPKYDNPMLFKGWVYIAEGTWDLRNAELTFSIMGIDQAFNITYSPVKDDVYLPTSFSSNMKADIFSISGYYNYLASIKYLDIEINKENDVIAQIEEKKKRDFEIKLDTNYHVKSDSLATKKDSTFWLSVRNAPLNEREIVSYEMKDSIQHRVDSLREKETNTKFRWGSILTGGKVGGDSTRFEFRYGGILGAWPQEYNFADGFWLGQKFTLSTRFNNRKNKISLSPQVYYTTARKSVVHKTTLALNYAPMKLGYAYIEAGEESTDYNPYGTNRKDNTYGSLIFGRNRSQLYNKKYFAVGNLIDISNGLRIGVGFTSAKRSGLEWNTRYSFAEGGRFLGVREKIVENRPEAKDFNLTAYSVLLTYSPYAYYSVYNGQKRYREITSPTFKLLYSEGFSGWHSNSSRFRKLQGEIRQGIKLGYFSYLAYSVEGGAFLGNKSKTHFADYKHFDATDYVVMRKSAYSSFLLIDSYEASTNDYWVQTQLNYSSQYLLLKRLPFLQRKLFRENLHLKALHTPNLKYYSEVGYSIDLLGFLNCGIFASFKKFDYDKFGVRLSIRTGLFGGND